MKFLQELRGHLTVMPASLLHYHNYVLSYFIAYMYQYHGYDFTGGEEGRGEKEYDHTL